MSHPIEWKHASPNEPGFHSVITPGQSPCRAVHAFRLNLRSGDTHTFEPGQLEMNAVIVSGKARLLANGNPHDLNRLDSFYFTPRDKVQVTATEKAILYLGGAIDEGHGKFFVRQFDLNLPLGEIHQIHGKPPYQREVFMTIDHGTPGSRLICGLTWGEDGRWTSWPPHQHTKDLEEAYFYFDLPKPQFALQLLSRRAGEFEAIHTVSSGDCIVLPEGYHPTVSSPGSQSTYFWILAAHKHSSRRYDLAVEDFFA